MRPIRPLPLLATLGALALALVPAVSRVASAAPASALAVGPMDGTWDIVLKSKTYPLNGDPPIVETLEGTALLSDSSSTGLSSLQMGGTLNGAPFVLMGNRIGKHYALYSITPPVLVSLSGNIVVPKATGMTKTFKGRGTLFTPAAMSDYTLTAKRQ